MKSSLTIECRLNIDIILDIFNSNQHVFIYIPCENRPKLPYSGSCHISKLVLLVDEHQFIPKSINSYQESMCVQNEWCHHLVVLLVIPYSECIFGKYCRIFSFLTKIPFVHQYKQTQRCASLVMLVAGTKLLTVRALFD